MTPRAVIMASGNGSNAQVLIDAAAAGSLGCEIVAVVSDRSDAHVLQRATAAGIPTEIVERGPGERRRAYDGRLAPIVAAFGPDLVVLAGWMRILTGWFCARFPIINLHPALPGEFPGAHAVADAYAAWQAGDIEQTGVMVHWVPDAAVDAGPVILSEVVPIETGDTLDSLTARVHAVEHRLLPRAVALALATGPPASLSEVSP